MILLLIVGWPVAVFLYVTFKLFVLVVDEIVFLWEKYANTNNVLDILFVGILWFNIIHAIALILGILYIILCCIIYYICLIQFLILILARTRHYRKVLVNK